MHKYLVVECLRVCLTYAQCYYSQCMRRTALATDNYKQLFAVITPYSGGASNMALLPYYIVIYGIDIAYVISV